ncbi:MAG: hypothetical protein F2839_02885 [Actinobacteria bacterium]|uniref:Unannotated protein n=1 Tax=freshwater metagenome TaxID=449393 RepID=A0A6J5YZJ7_9ZZZZ|nr:hypothetical protein [Actinomycetota bacterium]
MSDFEFLLPDVGEGIAEAEIIDWLVKVGDVVTVDQVVAVIETDKSQIEMPIPVAGTVSVLCGNPGDVLKVGSPLIKVTLGSGSSASAPISGDISAPAAVADVNIGKVSATPADSGVQLLGRIQASPSTRKLAASMGVNIAQVIGTGDNGRVTQEDVRAFISDPQPAVSVAKTVSPSSVSTFVEVPGISTTRKLQGVRRAIAHSMTSALQIPHILEFKEIDATSLLNARALLAKHMKLEKVSVTPLLLRACVVALQKHPNLNARYNVEKEELTEYESVRLGLATATDDGLMVPVIANAETLTASEMSAEIDILVAAAKSRTARPDQLNGSTFTMTNFGSFGTWLGTPVIRPPEVAIAGFGRVSDQVIAVAGVPVVRPVLPIVVAVDHRINDGAHLGAFVTTLAQVLLDAESLVS